jgi:hypothetical protein
MNLDDQSKLESMATSGQLTEHPGNPNGARVGDQSTVGSLDVDDVIGFQTMVGSGNSKYGLIHIASKDGQNEQITVNIKVQKQ